MGSDTMAVVVPARLVTVVVTTFVDVEPVFSVFEVRNARAHAYAVGVCVVGAHTLHRAQCVSSYSEVHQS